MAGKENNEICSLLNEWLMILDKADPNSEETQKGKKSIENIINELNKPLSQRDAKTVKLNLCYLQSIPALSKFARQSAHAIEAVCNGK